MEKKSKGLSIEVSPMINLQKERRGSAGNMKGECSRNPKYIINSKLLANRKGYELSEVRQLDR